MIAVVVRGTEYKSGKFVYENTEARTLGQISDCTIIVVTAMRRTHSVVW